MVNLHTICSPSETNIRTELIASLSAFDARPALRDTHTRGHKRSHTSEHYRICGAKSTPESWSSSTCLGPRVTNRPPRAYRRGPHCDQDQAQSPAAGSCSQPIPPNRALQRTSLRSMIMICDQEAESRLSVGRAHLLQL